VFRENQNEPDVFAAAVTHEEIATLSGMLPHCRLTRPPPGSADER
jgi:hypothetical protein